MIWIPFFIASVQVVLSTSYEHLLAESESQSFINFFRQVLTSSWNAVDETNGVL